MTKKLFDLLDVVEKKIDSHPEVDSSVSKVSVGWHIEHLLIAIINICGMLESSNPKEYKRTFNLFRNTFLRLRLFPRGKAKSPKEGLPSGNADSVKLNELVFQCRRSLPKIVDLSNEHFFSHPYFGQLNRDETIVFLETHTSHHLKIIDEILR